MFKEFHKKFKALTPKDKAEEVIREHIVNDASFVEKYSDRIHLKNKEED